MCMQYVYVYIYIHMSFITAKGLASERDTVRICPSIKHGHGPWQWSPTEQHLPWEPRGKGGLNSLLSWLGRRHAPTQIQHFRSFFVQATSMMSSKSFWKGSRMLFRIWTLREWLSPQCTTRHPEDLRLSKWHVIPDNFHSEGRLLRLACAEKD